MKDADEAVVATKSALTFEAPDGGSWMLDTTHHGKRPVSRYMQPIYQDVFPAALGIVLERYGLPLREFRVKIINGCFYVRPMGIGEPENPKGDPPLFLMKLITRLHPTLRRRNRIAAEAWEQKRWREDVDQWFNGLRDEVIASNLVIQDVEITSLGDVDLATHIALVTTHLREQAFQSGATHGGDLIPVGDYMAHSSRWGIDPSDAAGLLTGSSPATLETAKMLQPVGQAVAATTTVPASIAELRALGSDVSAAIDEWLRYHGHRVVTSDDIDGPTLFERPDLQLRALLATPAEPIEASAPPVQAIRDQIPAHDRELFDELLTEARYGQRLRDDNVGVRWNWSVGLVRRALLEAAGRLAHRGALTSEEHVIELESTEVQCLLRGETTPSAPDVAERWAFRQSVIETEPPMNLGPTPADPPIAAFPQALARATGAILAMIGSMQGEPGAEPLAGVGVGSRPHTGRAIVVADAIEALERLEPGDVIITSYTGPSWNSLLPTVGALVVEEGGAMCHAAIVAREFDIPALIGVADATGLIDDGATVTVDPTTGLVTTV